MAKNQKKKLEYTLEFKEDKQNRCVICWLKLDYWNLFNYVGSRGGWPYPEEDMLIKATTFAHERDPWDPEGLKRLARKKALRKMNWRLAKIFFNLQRKLSKESEIAFREYAKFITHYRALDDEIAGHEYYDNWRKQETQE